MASGQALDYQVATVVNDPKTGKDRWTNLGVAFQNEKSIVAFLDAAPINGKLVLTRPREQG